jgi:hypothetical protein
MTIFPLLVLTCGFSSSIAGGMICDRFGKNNPMTKSLVCVIGQLIALPMMTTALLLKNNFYLSISLIGARYFIGEVWKSPNITMI